MPLSDHPTPPVTVPLNCRGWLPAVEPFEADPKPLGRFYVSSEFREIRKAAREKGTSTVPVFTSQAAFASSDH